MKGVSFLNLNQFNVYSGVHTYDDLGLILSQRTISVPEPKLETVEIPGMDGELDLTESLGPVRYKNRVLTYTFSFPGRSADFLAKLSEVSNLLHGRHFARIIDDDDKGHYWVGRVKLNELVSQKGIGQIILECNVLPYKIPVEAAGDDWLWDPFSFVNGIIYPADFTMESGDSLVVNLPCEGKFVSPTFTIVIDGYGSVTIRDPSMVTAVKIGPGTVTYKPAYVLRPGDNKFTITCSATSASFSISYEGGSL